MSGYRKGAGPQSITIEALFLGSSDLYKSENKREFTLIVDGDRFDYGAMMYSPYTVEEHDGKETFYAGVPPTRMNPTIPSDARVITHVPIKNLVVGSLDKFIVGFNRKAEPFERVEHAKHITLKVGQNRVALSEDQVNTLRYFIRRALHG